MLAAGLRRAAFTAVGYVIAVLVAVAVTMTMILAATALPDQWLIGSVYTNLPDVNSMVSIGLVVTFMFGLPGFLVFIFASVQSESYE